MTAAIASTAPPRPDGVPPGAAWCPPAATFAELHKLHEARPDKRQYLRICTSFMFAGNVRGVMLRGVHGRALDIKRRTWSMGRVLVYSAGGPVPGVWAWTLADERQA